MADTPPQAYTVSVPRYIINLDLPPEERWNQVVDDYKGTKLKLKLMQGNSGFLGFSDS